MSVFTVAFLGPPGTHTHEAARKAFGAEVAYDEKSSIKAIFDALLSTAHVGVVPQENSIFGNVIETYDGLRTIGFVRGEITLKIQHCLLVKPGVQLDEVETIFSHEQALGQCSEFLTARIPSAALVKTASTAAGALAVLSSSPNCAAVCSKICGSLFGLSVLCEGIQNEASNFTRFYLITKNREATLPCYLSGHPYNRALMRISSQIPYHGSTAPISQLLAVLRISITRIDRRPSFRTSAFHDVYFIELQRDPEATAVEWSDEIVRAARRVEEVGGDAQLIGLW